MFLAAEADAPTVVDPKEAAEMVGLVYVSDHDPGISRQRAGTGFTYRLAEGGRLTDPDQLRRIRSLAVPPAWKHVWICRRRDGHIQATGRDARGRKQYRYHPEFRQVRESTKYEHIFAFAEMLPHIRAKVAQDMALRGLPRAKVLATVVHLLETTLIRIGNADYAKHNESFGLTTLRNRHVKVEGSDLRFQFKGKSGKTWQLRFRDRRIAKIVKSCQDLPGQELFQYLDASGERKAVTSADVNAYLREITGRDVTAKDFRTWADTVLAAMALNEFRGIESQAQAKKTIRAAIENVAARLGNTPTICRKCYVHPEVLNCYLAGELLLEVKAEVEAELRDDLPRLKAEEAAVLALLEQRLRRELKN